MKTAGRVLGIVGGAIALVYAFWFVFIGFLIIPSGSYTNEEGYAVEQQYSQNGGSILENDENVVLPFATQRIHPSDIGMLVFIALNLIGGILGLVGGIVINKKPVLSGVLLIIGAVFTALFILPMVLMVIAAVFAWIKPKGTIASVHAS
jgi:hypothetical protein